MRPDALLPTGPVGQKSQVSMISPSAALGKSAVPVMNLAGIRWRQAGMQRYNFPWPFPPTWL